MDLLIMLGTFDFHSVRVAMGYILVGIEFGGSMTSHIFAVCEL